MLCAGLVEIEMATRHSNGDIMESAEHEPVFKGKVELMRDIGGHWDIDDI